MSDLRRKTQVKTVSNGNGNGTGAAAIDGVGLNSRRPPRFNATKKIMELPDTLALNFDAVSGDDYFLFADPETDLQWRREFMNAVVVGGIEKYHFTLLPQLSTLIVEQLSGALPGAKKKQG